MRHLAERVQALAGSPSPICHVPYEEAYEAGFEDFRRRVPDIGKIGRLLGYAPRYRLDETLQTIIAEQQAREGSEQE